MVIENRNLAEGTVLSVTYKKAEHRCTVVKTEDGLAFRLADGQTFKSPSSAGKAITGRVSCDGWKFWSVAEGATAIAPTERSPRPGEPEAEKPARGPKLIRNVKKMPNQKAVEEGWTKFWCSACMKAFVAETTLVPGKCPEGHAREMADEFAVPAEAAEAE
jgi:hypothetical protein